MITLSALALDYVASRAGLTPCAVMLPNFVIIGAPRAGTTWLHQNLRAHPEVFLPKRKELHFFDQQYDKDIAHYESFFAEVDEQKAIGEATPAYMHGQYSDADIPKLMHQHLPEVKLIVSLRDPVDRIYSRYWNSKAKYEENESMSFEAKIDQPAEFVREGFYASHLQRFLRYYAREQILVLLFEDIVNNPKRYLAQVYEYLKIDPSFETGLEQVPINAAASKPKLAKSKAGWAMEKVFARMGMRQAASRIEQLNRGKQPEMDEHIRQKLIEIYAPHNAELQTLITNDISHWQHH